MSVPMVSACEERCPLPQTPWTVLACPWGKPPSAQSWGSGTKQKGCWDAHTCGTYVIGGERPLGHWTHTSTTYFTEALGRRGDAVHMPVSHVLIQHTPTTATATSTATQNHCCYSHHRCYSQLPLLPLPLTHIMIDSCVGHYLPVEKTPELEGAAAAAGSGVLQ